MLRHCYHCGPHTHTHAFLIMWRVLKNLDAPDVHLSVSAARIFPFREFIFGYIRTQTCSCAVSDVLSQTAGGRRSASPGVRSLHRQGSVLSSDRLSAASGALGLASAEPGTPRLTPQQLGVMGECLPSIADRYNGMLASYLRDAETHAELIFHRLQSMQK